MNTDDLAFIHFSTVAQEQLTAILQTVQSERYRFALAVRDQHAVLTLAHFALTYIVVVAEGGVQQTGTRGHGHEFVTETDQATAWDHVVKTHTALAIWIHVFQVSFTLTHRLHHRTLVLFFDVQRHVLERLLLAAIDFAEDNFRTGNRQFKTFTTHVFDQNRQVKLTTA
ncbi:hypothetical protein D3C79_709380 [compost metagenome]